MDITLKPFPWEPARPDESAAMDTAAATVAAHPARQATCDECDQLVQAVYVIARTFDLAIYRIARAAQSDEALNAIQQHRQRVTIDVLQQFADIFELSLEVLYAIAADPTVLEVAAINAKCLTAIDMHDLRNRRRN